MHFNIYTVITLIVFIIYGYSAFKSHRIIRKLATMVEITLHWSGRINVKELRAFQQTTDDDFILRQVSSAIFFLKLGKYVAYGGFLLFVILMIFQV